MSLRPRTVNFDETWKRLLDTLKAVLTLDKILKPVWNDRFSDVYALCVAYPEPLGEKLYAEIKKLFESHVQSLYETVSAPGVDLLPVYHKHWSQFSSGSMYLNLLFGYLNQHMKKQKADFSDISPYISFCSDAGEEIMEIGALALDIWKKKMIEPMKVELVRQLLAEIHKDRNGDITHENIVHDAIHSFVGVQEYQTKGALHLYEDIFEKPLLQETGDYYKREAAELHGACTCSTYIQKVDVRIQDEDLRSRKFLHPVSYSRVIRECEARLVEDYIPYLQGECRQMVKDEKTDDLSRMYKLLKHIPSGLHVMVFELQQHISQTGLTVIKSVGINSGPAPYIEALLEIYRKFHKLISITFHADSAFLSALDKACSTIVNYRHDPKRSCKSPELLAKYCDSILKKSTKRMADAELDETLSDIIVIFKYIDDKDIFQKFYSKMLAKRLIHNLSVSMDAEESMISKLKHACGHEYTNRLHQMFTDMSISADLNSSFSNFLTNTGVVLGQSFSLLVLKSNSWPLGQTSVSPLTIPSQLVKSVQMFEEYYNGQFSGRKLTWLQHLSSGEVRVAYLKRPYFITVTMYQMTVILLFNDRTSISFSDISASTQLLDKELKRTLQSLVDAKLIEKSKEEDDTQCTFSLNMNFSNKRTKLKITAAVQRETQQESEQTLSSVDNDRKMYLQAAIVRVMKSRKVLKHNNLIQEVISQAQSRFTPNISMIKKCIEALIDKQYLERRDGNKEEYSYVA